MYNDSGMPVNNPINAIYDLVLIVSNAIGSLCFIAGIAFIAGGLYQYLERRKNPNMIPLTQIVTLFVLGAALMTIQYIPMSAL